jgi:hypothetical protein
MPLGELGRRKKAVNLSQENCLYLVVQFLRLLGSTQIIYICINININYIDLF